MTAPELVQVELLLCPIGDTHAEQVVHAALTSLPGVEAVTIRPAGWNAEARTVTVTVNASRLDNPSGDRDVQEARRRHAETVRHYIDPWPFNEPEWHRDTVDDWMQPWGISYLMTAVTSDCVSADLPLPALLGDYRVIIPGPPTHPSATL